MTKEVISMDVNVSMTLGEASAVLAVLGLAKENDLHNSDNKELVSIRSTFPDDSFESSFISGGDKIGYALTEALLGAAVKALGFMLDEDNSSSSVTEEAWGKCD